LASSYIFHSLGSLESPVPVLLGAALAATVADYLINTSLVTAGASLSYGLPPSEVIRQLRIGRLSEFLVSYLGLGAIGLILVLLHEEVGFWSVATFVAPLVFARQMFFRSRALEEAHQELKQREQVLQALSNRMAEERQDERAQIAAYLHDDLAQLLFRLSLQVDVAKRHLRAKDIPSLEADLEAIRGTKNQTSDLIRILIRDLHRSPLGRAGLKEAVASFVEDVGQGLGVEFHTEIEDLPLSPPIQLLVYQIAREAVMNSLRHSSASEVGITLRLEQGVVELVLRDNGSGFDVETAGSEDHFGLAMMRERALVAGGTFDLSSAPSQGTTVTVRFPASWLQEGQPEEPAPPAPPAERPGYPEPASPAAEPVSA
jgi:signal transduction histidine kinase